jgi:hypothetical protein
MTGQLFKVQYVVEFFVKHKGLGDSLQSMPQISIPLMLMTPSKNVLSTENPRRLKHPRWSPYQYKHREFWLTADQEHEMVPYSKFRRWLIQREKDFVHELQMSQVQTYEGLVTADIS